MASITIDQLRVSFGDFRAVDDIALEIEDGAFVVFLGPSGCGKTTTLRCIAGLQEADSGSIRFNGEEILGLSPSARNVAMVFQSVSLYPHLTVAGNIAFPLKARGEPREVVRRQLDWVAEILDLGAIMKKRPGGLPPGALQRVALARAIVRKPNVLLLDEPLSAVDEQFRENMRWELGHIQRELGVTTIYVTHDQREAMALADRIVLMRDGRIEQFGDADDLYFRPRTAFTGYFIGSPSMNFFAAELRDDRVLLEGTALGGSGTEGLKHALAGREGCRLGIRPQNMVLSEADGLPHLAEASEVLPFQQGTERLFSFKLGERVFLGQDRSAGGTPEIGLDLSRAFLFDAQDQRIDLAPSAQEVAS
ncbi:MAG: ABC transporter ATP-binding protein [Kiloniellales bacterium]